MEVSLCVTIPDDFIVKLDDVDMHPEDKDHVIISYIESHLSELDYTAGAVSELVFQLREKNVEIVKKMKLELECTEIALNDYYQGNEDWDDQLLNNVQEALTQAKELEL